MKVVAFQQYYSYYLQIVMPTVAFRFIRQGGPIRFRFFVHRFCAFKNVATQAHILYQVPVLKHLQFPI